MSGSIPRERTRCLIFEFFYGNRPLCVPSVSADFGCKRTKDVTAYREHTHTLNLDSTIPTMGFGNAA